MIVPTQGQRLRYYLAVASGVGSGFLAVGHALQLDPQCFTDLAIFGAAFGVAIRPVEAAKLAAITVRPTPAPQPMPSAPAPGRGAS